MFRRFLGVFELLMFGFRVLILLGLGGFFFLAGLRAGKGPSDTIIIVTLGAVCIIVAVYRIFALFRSEPAKLPPACVVPDDISFGRTFKVYEPLVLKSSVHRARTVTGYGLASILLCSASGFWAQRWLDNFGHPRFPLKHIIPICVLGLSGLVLALTVLSRIRGLFSPTVNITLSHRWLRPGQTIGLTCQSRRTTRAQHHTVRLRGYEIQSVPFLTSQRIKCRVIHDSQLCSFDIPLGSDTVNTMIAVPDGLPNTTTGTDVQIAWILMVETAGPRWLRIPDRYQVDVRD